MSCRRLIALSVFGLLTLRAACDLHAEEVMRIQAERATSGDVFVGQRVTVNVKLMTQTIFAGVPVFEFPQVPNVILMHVDDRPVLGTEEVDDVSYTTQMHELALFCMKPGEFKIPPFAVRVDSPPKFGAPAEEHRLMTPEIAIQAKAPPGTEQMPGIVCSKKLEVEESWNPKPKKTAKVGDSVERRITFRTPDVPGMVMPVVPLTKVDGASVYLRPPIVQDHLERGTFTGERTDVAVYIFERAGTVEFPALRIPWWNLGSQKLESIELPAVSIEVQARTSQAAPTSSASSTESRLPLLLSIVVIVLIVGLGAFLWKNRHAASEPEQFAQIERACRSNDRSGAYNALVLWMQGRRTTSGLPTFASDLPGYATNEDLRSEVDKLQEAVLHPGIAWDSSRFLSTLRASRHLELRKAHESHSRPLPPLNPVGGSPV